MDLQTVSLDMHKTCCRSLTVMTERDNCSDQYALNGYTQSDCCCCCCNWC